VFDHGRSLQSKFLKTGTVTLQFMTNTDIGTHLGFVQSLILRDSCSTSLRSKAEVKYVASRDNTRNGLNSLVLKDDFS